ncbi:MAG: AAA family ATPase [Dysosmobacter sp.]|nr:AAA family ATPase [Dysosmobacter sp.]
MNIREAIRQTELALRAYELRDAQGLPLIPLAAQRPIYLLGTPGVGKTEAAAEVARRLDVGLVSYTLTHHTRQSALGLPQIVRRSFGGAETAVTEYTMSEIVAGVYRYMEQTGRTRGILFLDEINCVSETLSPMMLQFLQCKTFGNQRLPEGWLIAAAGNPPEYNRSVRDFDVVTLDRVKRMDVEADFSVWKEYARKRGLHGAVISYLDIKKENFYHMETTVDGMQFATARGWEDLSELLYAYEKLGIPVNAQVVGEYIQLPRIARDFANYLELYYKYQRTYHVEDILRGKWPGSTVLELRAAPFDERLAVLGLLLSRLTEAAGKTRRQDALTESLHEALLEVRDRADGTAAQAVLESLASGERDALRRAADAGQLDKDRRDARLRVIRALEDYQQRLVREVVPDSEAMDTLRDWFGRQVDARAALGDETGSMFDSAFRFLEETFGDSQELVLFVTELTAGPDTSWFVENFGCDAYFRHNKELLFDDSRRRISADIAAARQADGASAPEI